MIRYVTKVGAYPLKLLIILFLYKTNKEMEYMVITSIHI